MDWIDLAPDRDRWTAVVNAVMNLRFTYGVSQSVSFCYLLPTSICIHLALTGQHLLLSQRFSDGQIKDQHSILSSSPPSSYVFSIPFACIRNILRSELTESSPGLTVYRQTCRGGR